jgi:hypothetical protein
VARPSKRNSFITRLRSVGLVRLALCTLVGLAGAWFALALAVSGVTRLKAPQVALAAMPVESVALASRADQLFFANPKNPPRSASTMALKALESQAINAKALRAGLCS